MPRYSSLQHISKLFDSLKCGTWPGKEIRGMIRTPAINCTPNCFCYKDDGRTAAATATNEMVKEAVQAVFEFYLLVSQGNHTNLFLKALGD
jgi:hypothetical protein